jgi:hypothetical protein
MNNGINFDRYRSIDRTFSLYDLAWSLAGVLIFGLAGDFYIEAGICEEIM